MKRWLLEEIMLGGRESPQYGFASMGDVFEPPSKIVNESRLKSKECSVIEINHLTGWLKYLKHNSPTAEKHYCVVERNFYF